jgi:hypothetical protein
MVLVLCLLRVKPAPCADASQYPSAVSPPQSGPLGATSEDHVFMRGSGVPALPLPLWTYLCQPGLLHGGIGRNERVRPSN